MTTAVTVDQLRNLTNRAAAGLTVDEQARLRDGIDQMHYQLDQTRNAAALHRQGLITTAELYAVIEAGAAPTPAALDDRPADDTTPGCTCGHTGRGVSWHADECLWRRSVVDCPGRPTPG